MEIELPNHINVVINAKISSGELTKKEGKKISDEIKNRKNTNDLSKSANDILKVAKRKANTEARKTLSGLTGVKAPTVGKKISTHDRLKSFGADPEFLKRLTSKQYDDLAIIFKINDKKSRDVIDNVSTLSDSMLKKINFMQEFNGFSHIEKDLDKAYSHLEKSKKIILDHSDIMSPDEVRRFSELFASIMAMARAVRREV